MLGEIVTGRGMLTLVAAIFCGATLRVGSLSATPNESRQIHAAAFADAQASWRTQLEQWNSVEGTIKETVKRDDTEFLSDVRLALRDGRFFLVDYRSHPAHPSRVLVANNGDYWFEIHCVASADAWVIARAYENSGDHRIDAWAETRQIFGYRNLVNPFYVNRESLVDVVSQDYFSLLRFEKRPDGLYEMEFDYKHPWVQREMVWANTIQHGVAVLDPARGWCIVSANYDGTEPQGDTYQIEKTFTFAADQPGSANPIEVEQVSSGSEGIFRTINATCDLKIGASIDKDEFYLSYYGLPELTGNRTRRWFLYALGIGLALIFGGVVIRRIASRRL